MRQCSDKGVVLCALHNKFIHSTSVLTPSGVSSLTYYSRAFLRGFFLRVFCQREVDNVFNHSGDLIAGAMETGGFFNTLFIHIQRAIDFNL